MTSFDLDEVLDREIKFGSFQILIFILMAFPIFLNGIASSSYIFTAGNLNYRLDCVKFNYANESVNFGFIGARFRNVMLVTMIQAI